MKLYIHTGNAAFEGDMYGHELGRIVHHLAMTIEASSRKDAQVETSLRDINGNVVGYASPLGTLVTPKPGVFILKIDTDNAAFDGEGYPHEVSRILRMAASRLADNDFDFKLRDINGNTVCRAVGMSEDIEAPAEKPGD